MNRIVLVLIGALFTFSTSWVGLVVVPYFQLQPTEPLVDDSGNQFPRPYSNTSLAGRTVYIANGCMYCHSQQVRGGKSIWNVNPEQSFGGDQHVSRNFGPRRTVPRDYVHDKPHLLGTMRTGPDLINVATRRDAKWNHQHLYNPRLTSPGSTMPTFAFLYEKRRVEGSPSPERVPLTEVPARDEALRILNLPPDELAARPPTEQADLLDKQVMLLRLAFPAAGGSADGTPAAAWLAKTGLGEKFRQLPAVSRKAVIDRAYDGLDDLVYLEAGWEVVPTADARNLVDYLMSLDRTYPLPEADQ